MPISTTSRIGTAPGWAAALHWMPADTPDNPFSREVLDCRPACAAFWEMMAGHANASVVEQLSELALGTQNPSRDQSQLVTCPNLSLAAHFDGAGLLVCAASPPGTRWKAVVDAQTLTFRRSWSGEIVHVASWQRNGDEVLLGSLSSLSTAVQFDRAFAAAEFEFLARTFVQGVAWPFPIPASMSSEDKAGIAIWGWREYGRLAQFGTQVHV